MKVVVCPNAFKGCLTSAEACAALVRGVQAAAPEAQCVSCPLADGGDSSLEVLTQLAGGELHSVDGLRGVRSDGPPVAARYGVLRGGETLVLEMAEVSGLRLLPRACEQDPLRTSTEGLGELVLRAVADTEERTGSAVRRVLLCLGGSATNDMGVGMAAALGYRFFDGEGAELRHPVGGDLRRVRRVDASGARRDVVDRVAFEAVCDVATPLLGPDGATYTFGPQKGADTADALATLEEGLRAVAEACAAAALPAAAAQPLTSLVGGGAAGGLGAGCVAFLGGVLRPGFDVVAEAAGLAAALEGADLALSGEGKMDAQTSAGKVPEGVSRACKKAGGVPLVCVAGCVEGAAPEGVDAAVFSLCDRPMALAEAMEPREAERLLAATAKNVVKLFLAGRAAGRKE
eukprot:Rhum_TRINITY_DN13395_c0_g2::Rhum_TRINITY_DN13395_c0_g2_i1::g.59755::m.59755/K00865/glxK, garK; glycerate 2-kinase